MTRQPWPAGPVVALAVAAACGGSGVASGVGGVDASTHDGSSTDSATGAGDVASDDRPDAQSTDAAMDGSLGADSRPEDAGTQRHPDSGDAAACPIFTAAVDYAVSSPIHVAVADLNGDGATDVAVVSIISGQVGVLLGRGDGTFGLATEFTAGNGAEALAIDDLNGDALPDIVAFVGLGHKGAAASVLIGNGDGTFQSAVQYPFGKGSYVSGVAADLNRDGLLDLVGTDSSDDSVSVLLGNGDGTFGVATSYAAGSSPVWVTAGDFNRDHRVDLAVLSGGEVDIFLGNGDGTLRSGVAYGASGRSMVINVGDVNGDGTVDVATDGIFFLPGNGDGTFRMQEKRELGGWLAPGDFNGDAIVDLGTTTALKAAGVFFGRGNGIFERSSSEPVPNAVHTTAAGDFNADGKLDLVVTNAGANSVSVLLNSGSCWDGPSADGGNDAREVGGGG